MPVTTPRAIVEKRLRALIRQLPGVSAGDVEAIHQARVASRRLREVLPVLSGAADRAEARRVRRAVRSVTRALGHLRELDVSLMLLSQLAGEMPGLEPAISTVRSSIEQDRRVEHARAAGAMAVLDVDRLVEEATAIAEVAGLRPGVWRCRALLARRTAARARALEAAVGAAGLLYAADRMHAVRIAAKKLRYAMEIAGELRGVAVATSLARLKGLQDLLGRLHDLEVVACRVRDVTVDARRGRPSLDRLTAALEGEIRTLHGVFLERRTHVDAVYRQCHRVCLQVAPPGRRMARAGGQPPARLASGG